MIKYPVFTLRRKGIELKSSILLKQKAKQTQKKGSAP